MFTLHNLHILYIFRYYIYITYLEHIDDAKISFSIIGGLIKRNNWIPNEMFERKYTRGISCIKFRILNVQ